MFDQPRSIKKLRKGTYYTILNCKNGLALSMPPTNKYIKDKPEFQQWDPSNVNQLWMIEEIGSNKYEIVHAASTLVIQSLPGCNLCKLQFGRQKACQLYYLQNGKEIDKLRYQNMRKETTGIKYENPASKLMQQQQMAREPQKSDSKAFKNKVGTIRAGQRVIQKIRIKQREKSKKYLYYDVTNKSSNIKALQQKKSSMNDSKVNILKFMEIDLELQSDSSLWEIRQVFTHQNQILSKTCYIESFRSGFVLDVPQASDKKGVQIIQYPCNFRFNQKWILKKVDENNGCGYYTIKNAKSGLYLDIKGQSTKQGASIIQWEAQESKNQIWRLEQQGKRVYLLRSALEKDLLLGVKQNSLKQQAQIITSKIETQCFWVIHGFIPE